MRFVSAYVYLIVAAIACCGIGANSDNNRSIHQICNSAFLGTNPKRSGLSSSSSSALSRKVVPVCFISTNANEKKIHKVFFNGRDHSPSSSFHLKHQKVEPSLAKKDRRTNRKGGRSGTRASLIKSHEINISRNRHTPTHTGMKSMNLKNSINANNLSRRSLFLEARSSLSSAALFASLSLFAGSFLVKNDAASAAEVLEKTITTPSKSPRKPWAPTEALLPATRVRILLNQAIDLASQLPTSASATGNGNHYNSNNINTITEQRLQTQEILSQLDAILAPPTKTSDLKPNKSIRIAFNTYTAYLRYDDQYAFTASPAVKKQLIREDRVPDVKQVITADLDLRDLYRNQVLNNVDEARAELRYQMDEFEKSKMNANKTGAISDLDANMDVDGEELLQLLKNAKAACDEWFGLIAEEDVKEALEIVLAASDNVKER